MIQGDVDTPFTEIQNIEVPVLKWIPRKEIKGQIKEMEGRIKADIIKWVAGMLAAQAAIVAALLKIL